jgi:hypothetical protein
VYRSRTGGNEWEALTKGLPQSNCYVNVLRSAMAVDSLDPCKEFQTGVIAPVHILDDKEKWFIRGMHRKKLRQECKQAAFLALRI